MALVEVKVPDIGDFKEVEVIELLVKPGDTVKLEQSLLTVESDKASMEIPSSHAGVVKELRVKLGDKVAEGSMVLVLEVGEAAAVSASAPTPTSAVAAPTVAASSPPPPPSSIKEEGVKSASSIKEEGVKSASSIKEEGVKSASSIKEERVEALALIDVLVPDIGDFDEVAVIEVMVKVGDAIKLEQSLITVESDKAAMEIPSSHAGIVKDVRVKVGDKVAKGSLVVVIEAVGTAAPAVVAAAPAPASASAPAPAPAPAPAAVAAVAPTADRVVPTAALPAHQPTVLQTALPHASPSIRKLARELGVPLSEVKGTGLKSRITQDDVQSFVKNVMAGASQTVAQSLATAAKAPAVQAAGSGSGGSFPGLLAWPSVDYAKFGAVERKDLSRIKKISGANLHRNWVLIPHVTNHDDADITDLEAFRVATNQENEKSGVKVTMLAFLIKASVAALKKFPEFNASLDGDQIVYKQYFHIGFAADTPNGLMVPVIKDADKKGVMQISQEMSELAKKARDGKLNPVEMSGGCFSISSLGGIGGRYFTPIINAPEVAIMGVCKSSMQPVWDGKAFQPRLILPLSLSWDHRVIDGAAAARFNVYLASILADFRRVLL